MLNGIKVGPHFNPSTELTAKPSGVSACLCRARQTGAKAGMAKEERSKYTRSWWRSWSGSGFVWGSRGLERGR